MQEYKLGEKVYVFKAQKGEIIFPDSQAVIHLAEVNTSGYIQYSVKVIRKDGVMDTWIVNHASMARTEDEIKQKANIYKQFNDAEKAKYVELFGAPEFNPVELGLK